MISASENSDTGPSATVFLPNSKTLNTLDEKQSNHWKINAINCFYNYKKTVFDH